MHGKLTSTCRIPTPLIRISLISQPCRVCLPKVLQQELLLFFHFNLIALSCAGPYGSGRQNHYQEVTAFPDASMKLYSKVILKRG